jgi:hypothetical protein
VRDLEGFRSHLMELEEMGRLDKDGAVAEKKSIVK